MGGMDIEVMRKLVERQRQSLVDWMTEYMRSVERELEMKVEIIKAENQSADNQPAIKFFSAMKSDILEFETEVAKLKARTDKAKQRPAIDTGSSIEADIQEFQEGGMSYRDAVREASKRRPDFSSATLPRATRPRR